MVRSIPFGFDLAVDNVSLVRNEPEQLIISLILELRANGESYQAIATELESREVFVPSWQLMTTATSTQPIVRQCYICDRVLHGRFENDHFPTPKSMGGKITMPICLSCHDDKDRTLFGNWNPSATFAAMVSLWSSASREERLLLAKMFHVCSQGTATIENGRNKK